MLDFSLANYTAVALHPSERSMRWALGLVCPYIVTIDMCLGGWAWSDPCPSPLPRCTEDFRSSWIFTYVLLRGWRNVLGKSASGPEESHNLESSGWTSQRLQESFRTIIRNQPRKDQSGKNRKLNGRKWVDVWCPNRQELNQSKFKRLNFISLDFRVVWSTYVVEW